MRSRRRIRRRRRRAALARAWGATPDGASGLEKIAHAVPMRSLGNAFDVAQVEAFVKRVEKLRGETEGEAVDGDGD